MERTIPLAFAATVDRRPGRVALRWQTEAGWDQLDWRDYADRACRLAGALRALGLRRGERVCLMLRNRPEFHIADMAIQLAGAVPVSIYNSSPPENIGYVAAHARARFAVVEDRFIPRCRAAQPMMPELQAVIGVGAASDADEAFDDLLTGDAVDLTEAAAAVCPADLATVIYTSGTTGPPKGVMLTQANIVFAAGVKEALYGRMLEGLRSISYLPMAHVGERLLTHYLHVTQGTVVTPCPDLGRLSEHLVAIQPEMFGAAPRLWEKLQQAIEAQVAAVAAEEDFAHARTLGLEFFAAEQDGSVDVNLADRWTRARLEAILPFLRPVGLGEVIVAMTGSAPISRSMIDYFVSLGLPLSEAWGMSETSGVGSGGDPFRIRPGTAGRPVPGVEIRTADDGEILVRGPNLFAGYLSDESRTAESFDADGWFHTGDAGVFDAEGNLRIVDRLKEMIVPSSGHNVSPVNLESALKESPLVAQACVVGDGRPYVGALVVVEPRVAGWDAEELRREIRRHVDAVNDRFPRSEQIRAFVVLTEEWPVDGEFLTPTGKLKRRVIRERFAAEIESLYPGSPGSDMSDRQLDLFIAAEERG